MPTFWRPGEELVVEWGRWGGSLLGWRMACLLTALKLVTLKLSSYTSLRSHRGGSPFLFRVSTHSNQCVTVPKMLNSTDTDTFFRYQILSIPIPVLFSGTKFSNTGSDATRKNEKFPVPVAVPVIKLLN